MQNPIYSKNTTLNWTLSNLTTSLSFLNNNFIKGAIPLIISPGFSYGIGKTG